MLRFKKVVAWISIIFVLFLAQGIALSFIYEKEIKQLALEELNKSLASPVEVKKINLNFWKHFPFISLSFEGVHIQGSNPNISSSLLRAEEISLLFNFWDLYKGSYKVQKLIVKKATILTAFDRLGVANYLIFKKSEDEPSDFLINLKEVQLIDCRYSYLDYKSGDQYLFFVEKLKCSGLIQNDKIDLQTVADGYCQLIQIDGKKFLVQKKVQLQGPFQILLQDEIINLNDLSSTIEGMNFKIKGEIDVQERAIDYRLSAIADDVQLEELKKILPARYNQYINKYKAEGSFQAKMTLKGRSSNTQTPLLEAKASIENGQIQIENAEDFGKLDRITTELFYSNKSSSSLEDDVLELKKFQCFIQNKPLVGKLLIRDLDRFMLDFSIKTSQDAKNIFNLLNIEPISIDQGTVELDVEVKGYYDDLINPKANQAIRSKGEIKLNDLGVGFKNSSLEISGLNAILQFDQHDLKINHAKFVVGKSDFEINGYVRNILGVILNEKQELSLQAKLVSNTLDLYDLLSSNTTTTADNPTQIALPNWIDADLHVEIGKLQFEKFKAYDIQGKIKADELKVSSEYLAFRAQGGLVFSNFSFDMANPKMMPLKLNFILNKIDIHQMFEEFNNFGLEIITANNIFGMVSASMQTEIFLNQHLDSDLDKFYAKGNVVIEEGKLLKFDPLLSLGKYIDINELVDLRFSKLENTIEIKNQTLYIPTMHVSSNAIDLDISGTHQFNNNIDYSIKVLLADLLWKKSRKNSDAAFGEIENDSEGRAALYIRMYGDAENPKFTLDKRSIKKKMKEDLRKEKVQVKDVLKNEIDGWFKKDQEFQIEQEQELQDWEKDIPMKQEVTTPSNTKADSTKAKSKLQRLKKKLQEPVIDDEQ